MSSIGTCNEQVASLSVSLRRVQCEPRPLFPRNARNRKIASDKRKEETDCISRLDHSR